MAVSFQLIQEGPEVGVRWWLYPKYVRMQLTVCVPLSLYCSFTNSAPETTHIFASDLVAHECCPLSNLVSSESCQAHMHGFGPFSFYFLYLVLSPVLSPFYALLF